MEPKPLTELSLRGRTALVTGGARRVGAVISERLAALGARIVIHHHTSSEEADDLARRLGASEARLESADLTDRAEVTALFDRLALADWLPDILVNSASEFLPSRSDAVDFDVWDRTLALNLTAPYQMTMEASRRLDGRPGDVVNIADVWGSRPLRRYVAYSVSKAGLLMLTQSLAQVLAPVVRVNAVAPGPVLLPDYYDEERRDRALRNTLLKREGSAADVANAVAFLVAGTTYATGSVITIDGGRSAM